MAWVRGSRRESWRGGMKRTARHGILIMIIAALACIVGCNGDLNRSSAPVKLVVTQTQNLTRYDTAPGAANCDQEFGEVNVQAIPLQSTTNANLPVDSRFNSVELTSYRVSYVRRDGGTLVPEPFTMATSGLLTTGGAGASLSNFIVLRSTALNQAPFAALTTSGGGRDPETGLSTITMDVVLEVFGQTLAGERVSGSTRMTLRFCYSCGGCA